MFLGRGEAVERGIQSTVLDKYPGVGFLGHSVKRLIFKPKKHMFEGNCREVLYKNELLCRAHSFSGTYAFGRMRIPEFGDTVSPAVELNFLISWSTRDSWDPQER